jgi:hypothetical protein
MVSPDTFEERMKSEIPLTLDYNYYLENRLGDCIDELFRACYTISGTGSEDNSCLEIMNDSGDMVCINNEPINELIGLMKKKKLTLKNVEIYNSSS